MTGLKTLVQKYFDESFYFKIIHKEKIEKDYNYLISFLTAREKKILYSYSSFRSQVYFLAGRIILKDLVSLFLKKNKIGFSKIEILKNNIGKPLIYIDNNLFSNIFFSLSHKDYIAACIYNKPVGIDIEIIKESFVSIRHRFLKRSQDYLIEEYLDKYRSYNYFGFYIDFLNDLFSTSLWSSCESILKMKTISFFDLKNKIELKKIAFKNQSLNYTINYNKYTFKSKTIVSYPYILNISF